ncbi:hypothetical protein SDC9_115698 [bioreactor metagenome]|uniref:DUF1460 domain-containing protein n=1 Tax=bioreactor metagenome TaxID=1076179 RepID=A0A645C480_9ZZZZ
MNRRNFVKSLTMLGASAIITPAIFAKQSNNKKDINTDVTTVKFNDIINRAKSQKWYLLPITDLLARIALEFINTPYLAGTLDTNPTVENVIINFSGLDCVTFFENSLCLARCIKKQKYKFNDLIESVKYTRYYDGVISDYSSRLHYTSDWIMNNVKKGTVKDITKEIGGIEHKFDLSYMTTHTESYKALSQPNSETLIAKIKEAEMRINKQTFYIIPNKNIAKAQKYINDGDIIAIAISTAGLDYGHLGIAFNDKLMHASLKSQKVIIDKSISNYVNAGKRNIGITVLRPLET